MKLIPRPRQNGIIAIKVREEDTLLEARLTNGENEIILALRSGRAIRFNEQRVRPMGRNASGVRGIRLSSEKDEVIGMICLENGTRIFLLYQKMAMVKNPNWMITGLPTGEEKVLKP